MSFVDNLTSLENEKDPTDVRTMSIKKERRDQVRARFDFVCLFSGLLLESKKCHAKHS